MSGMWGPDFAAGRGHNGARTTPTVETPGRARHREPRPAPLSRFGFSGRDASPRAGNGGCNLGPPHLDALGMRHEKEKETRIPEVPQLLIFSF